MAFRLVVGLGNPGASYERTRHNVGFRVLDYLSEKEGWAFQRNDLGPVDFGMSQGVRYIKPMTYMNASGDAVSAWLRYYKIPLEDLLVVVDEVQLPLGQIRIRRSGSAGGHNGLGSIETTIGSGQYARIRCGVGGCPTGQKLENYVLGKFAAGEDTVVKEMIARAAEAVRCCQSQGIEIAMNAFNRNVES